MGRHKIKKSLRKHTISASINIENYKRFDELGIKNKSKLVNELLMKHFGMSILEKISI